MLNKMMTAYLLKNRGTVVTDKSIIKDEEYEEVSLIIPMREIKEWADRIYMLGLDMDEEDDEEEDE